MIFWHHHGGKNMKEWNFELFILVMFTNGCNCVSLKC